MDVGLVETEASGDGVLLVGEREWGALVGEGVEFDLAIGGRWSGGRGGGGRVVEGEVADEKPDERTGIHDWLE